jgi:probable rRNA maturation factor
MKFEIAIFNDTTYKRIPQAKMKAAIERVLRGEKFRGKSIIEASVTVVIIDDSRIHTMNNEFLQHDYPTDIITFPLEEQVIDGELYISIETAHRQATEYGVSLTNELLRLAAHGTLHLVGYDDSTDSNRAQMSILEDTYIRTRQ